MISIKEKQWSAVVAQDLPEEQISMCLQLTIQRMVRKVIISAILSP